MAPLDGCVLTWPHYDGVQAWWAMHGKRPEGQPNDASNARVRKGERMSLKLKNSPAEGNETILLHWLNGTVRSITGLKTI